MYYNSTIKERLRGHYKDLTSSTEVLAGICIALSIIPVINLLVACVIMLGDAIASASELHHKYVSYIKRKQENI